MISLEFIRQTIMKLMSFNIPFWLLLAIMGFMGYVSRRSNRGDKHLGDLMLVSTFTAIIIVGFGVATIRYPNSFGIDTDMINQISTSMYSNYYTVEEQRGHILPETVEGISEQIYDGCKGDIGCFKNNSYGFVNNNIEYVSDTSQFGKDEYYQRPVQTLANERGDCEDFSFLLVSILRNYINKSYAVEYKSHMAVGVCKNNSLIRYDPTMQSFTGSKINISETQGIIGDGRAETNTSILCG